jgi:hypothetical protein
MNRLALTRRSLSPPIRQQVVDAEQVGVRLVGVQRRQQSRTLLHDPHPGMTMAMDPAFVALGQAEAPFQIEIVLREIRVIATDKQPGLETRHHCAHMLAHRVAAPLEPSLKRLEIHLTSDTIAVRRIQGGRDIDDVLDVSPDRVLGLPDRAQAAVDEPGQPPQERLGAPPFFAARLRSIDWRTSSRASAIRKPGG